MSIADRPMQTLPAVETDVDHLLGCRGAGVVVVIALIFGVALLVGAMTASLGAGILVGLAGAGASVVLCRACRFGDGEIR